MGVTNIRTMQRLLHLALLAFVLAFAAGCISPAQRLDASITSQFRIGASTRAEIEQTLGKPGMAVSGSNRKTAAIYHYGRFKPVSRLPASSVLPTPAGTFVLRSFSILYDARGIAEKISQHEAAVDCHRDMLGLWLGDSFAEKDLARIQKGRTSAKELAGYFGPPMDRAFTVDGYTVVFWFYSRIQGRFAMHKTHQGLKVILNEDGIVLDYMTEGDLQPAIESR